ncbi:MAG: hypothetical protein WCD79_04040 [Chthoniobacteraceae bacterium]
MTQWLTVTYACVITRAMSISLQTLKEAVQIKEQISQLEARLSRILGGSSVPVKSTAAKKGARGMSAAGRANIIAAQKARWAKAKGEQAPAGKPATGSKKKTSYPQPDGQR